MIIVPRVLFLDRWRPLIEIRTIRFIFIYSACLRSCATTLVNNFWYNFTVAMKTSPFPLFTDAIKYILAC